MDRHHRQGWTLFNKLPQDDLGTGRWFVLHLCGCSSAGRARPRHGRGHEFDTRHPLHFGCVHPLRCRVNGVGGTGCARLTARVTCSETPHPTGCSRLGTAEVDRQTSGLFASLTQRPECRPRVRLPHEAPDQFAEIAQQVERRVEGACVGGSKPSLGTSEQNLVSSVGFRAPVYEAGGRTFEPCTRCQFMSVWRSWQRACFGNTRPQVRSLPPRPTASVCLGVAVAQGQSCGM